MLRFFPIGLCSLLLKEKLMIQTAFLRFVVSLQKSYPYFLLYLAAAYCMLASDDKVIATKATIHLLSTSYVPGAGLSASHVLTHMIFIVILSECCYDLLFPILQMRKSRFRRAWWFVGKWQSRDGFEL